MTTNTLRKDKAWLHEQTLKIHIEEIEKLTSPGGMLNVNDRIQYCQSTNDKNSTQCCFKCNRSSHIVRESSQTFCLATALQISTTSEHVTTFQISCCGEK